MPWDIHLAYWSYQFIDCTVPLESVDSWSLTLSGCVCQLLPTYQMQRSHHIGTLELSLMLLPQQTMKYASVSWDTIENRCLSP